MFRSIPSARGFARVAACITGTALSVLVPGQAAMASYPVSSQTAYTSNAAPEAIELSGLVASPSHPNWYWSISDVWKRTDTPTACSGLSAEALTGCQQVQRARIWAIRLDPVSHAVIEARPFAIDNPGWALDPFIAQDNDWEDLTVGPQRTTADGTSTRNLIIGATGDAKVNRVYDAAGKDITCDTRRLIELVEPDLSDSTVTTWSPWKIFDIKNYVGLGGIKTCNVESLVQAPDAQGVPQAYLVTRTGGKLLSRSLELSTARDPGTSVAPVDSGAEYVPSVTYLGAVKGSRGAPFTAADTNGDDIVMLSPATAVKPCQVFSWTLGGATLATSVTSVDPTKDAINCKTTEGLAFTRDPNNPATFTRDLVAISDTKTSIRYWYLPAS